MFVTCSASNSAKNAALLAIVAVPSDSLQNIAALFKLSRRKLKEKAYLAYEDYVIYYRGCYIKVKCKSD